MPLRSSLVVASLSVVHGMRLPWTDLSSLREYEKKHGRVAIVSLASLGALSAEGVEAPVSWLSNRPVDEQLCFFAGAAIVEAAATLPRFEGLLSLRDDVRPGVFFVQEEKEEEGSADPFAERVEDWAGRVAMLAAAGALISGVV